MLLVALLPHAGHAQGFQLSGHVYHRSSADSVPLAGHLVVLHQVTARGGSPVDSARTDRLGAYFLEAPVRDTSAVYLASVSYADIGYFSQPVPAAEFTADTASTLVVFDTSSVGPPVRVVERHVVMRAQEADGSRSVLELLLLENPGSATLVAPDTSQPVWQGVLPPGAVNVEVAPSDVSTAAVYRRGDSIAVAAAMPPGLANRKRIVFGYIMPSGTRTFTVPVDQPTARLQFLIEDLDVELAAGPSFAEGVEDMEGVRFRRFEAQGVAAATEASFRLSGPRVTESLVRWAVIGTAAFVMFAVLLIWWRRTPVKAAVDVPDVLAAQIASLDDAFAARGDAASEAEQSAYRRRRADLKARLAAALARPSSNQ